MCILKNSNNFLFWCCLNNEDVSDDGFDYMLKNIIKDDKPYLYILFN